MNFLSAAISSFTGASIPYSVGAPASQADDVWSVNEGCNREGKHVTIFTFDLDPRRPKKVDPAQLEAGCRVHKKFSVLPGMLKLEDYIQNEQGIYMITEPVTKLDVEASSGEEGVLGLYQVLCALRLIHERGVAHNGGIRGDLLNCIYINGSGEWKLTGFERAQEGQKGKIDAKLVGEAVYNLFNYQKGFNQANAMRASGSSAIHGLPIADLLSGKKSVEEFVSEGDEYGKWFDTTAVKCYRRFQEFHILDMHQKLELFKGMALCGGVDRRFLINRGLVEMDLAFSAVLGGPDLPNKGQSLAQIVYLMHRIVVQCDDSAATDVYKGCFFKALPVADRTVRLLLLKLLPDLNSHLTDHEVQDKVYPQLASGFADTDLTMRIETLNAVGLVIGRITDRQLNNDLLRHLAKLQVDPNPVLRISVIETLVSISPQMHTTTRPGILITAFGKGLKDAHIKVRLTAVDAFINALDYFDAEACCVKVIGALAPAMVDKSSNVRSEAQKAMEMCMAKIESYIGAMNDSGENVNEGIENGPIDIHLDQLGESLLVEIPDLGEISLVKTKTYSQTSDSSPTPQPQQKRSAFGTTGLNSKLNNLVINDDDDDDDGWGFGDEADAKPISVKPKGQKSTRTTQARSVPRPSAKAITGSSTAGRKPGITLSKKSTASKLHVEAAIDDDDGWGNGW